MIKRSLLLSLLLVGSFQAHASAEATAKQLAETVCAACHGLDGNSVLPENPKLAGQIPEYLFKQMRDYSSIEGEAPARVNAVMNGMIVMVPDDETKRALAEYYAAQELKPESATSLDTIELGQQIWRAGIASKGVPACAACHGPAGAGMPAEYPRISGQFAQYTLTQLQAFRELERANDPNEMMRDIALKMTDAEMRAVADYAAGLR
ncbi:c-type cytochrome [Azoarcus taiwanensis]|uniref:C-type cytochrome n=1 Tax=Azoarcus taiwanensis TaxID=666964 RepID=A0A972F680_9RHOO|nr:c-type cytochrome [Azoarcus taiwanensis]NMG02113.1 c-type cytochrome [Azoarcus taiwanensis]